MDVPPEKRNLLIIDDSHQSMERFIDLFDDDYHVSSVGSDLAAVSAVKSDTPPDIVLLAFTNNQTGGLDDRLPAALRSQNIPWLAVIDGSQAIDIDHALDLGAAGFITPPFHPVQIKALVATHLELQRRMNRLADPFHDPLTKLPNRACFDLQCRNEWNRAMRSGQFLTLVLLEVDHFDAYLAACGRESGQHCLRQVALALSNSLKRAGDFVARFGEKEFATLLPYTAETEAWEIAAKIMDAVESLHIPHPTSPVTGFVTISQGVVCVDPDSCLPVETILAKAGDALRKAARKGGRLIDVITLEK